jgi:hypothetical protein
MLLELLWAEEPSLGSGAVIRVEFDQVSRSIIELKNPVKLAFPNYFESGSQSDGHAVILEPLDFTAEVVE